MAGAPDIQTMREQGVEALAKTPRGLVAPANIPAEARKILEDSLHRYVQTDDFKKLCKEQLMTESWMDGQTFGKWLEETNILVAAAHKDMGISPKK
jgi:tripartite-type tricarboxylate transporter receptor subunit TctC